MTLHRMNQKFCDWQLNLDVGRDQFVEAANALPGQGDYNGIIRAYRRGEWEQVAQKTALFRKLFESSPFNEALDFLEVQIGFEQARHYDDPKAVGAEKRLRRAALLYPKSHFLAPVSANMASFWLRNGRFQRALALYQKLSRGESKGDYDCVFQAGVAESHFQLNQWAKAGPQFERMLLTCQNRRLRVGGLLRLGDLERNGDLLKAEQHYQRARKDGIPLIDRHFRESLFNMGEVAYRRKRYPSAGHFFDQFLSVIGDKSRCIPVALKRGADAAAASGEKIGKVVGLYLGVKDKVPDTNVGRASYLHALLLTLMEKNSIERARRLRIIEEELPKIKDPTWFNRIQAELYLVQLALGNMDALGELERLSRPDDSFLRETDYVEFIQRTTGKIIGDGGLKLSRSEVKEPLQYLKRIEHIFDRWASKGPYAIRVGDRYAEIALQEARQSLSSGKIPRALAFLEYWKRSPLWKVRPVRPGEQAALVEAAIRPFFDPQGGPKGTVEAITQLRTHAKELEVFTGDFQRYVGFVLSARGLEANPLKTRLGSEPSDSVLAKLPKEMGAFVRLELGRALQKQKKYTAAAKHFRVAMSGAYRVEAEKGLISAWESSGNYSDLLSLAKKRIADESKEEVRSHYLGLALAWAEAGQLWKETGFFSGFLEEKSIRNQVLTFLGRAYYETKKCESSVAAYAQVEKKTAVGDQYRFGKCLAVLDRTPQAKKVLQDVARSKDRSWRELARSQIQQLKNP